ncbi:hypothetical protein [Catellatospora bangladeshensis]|nr:hypothetical protein [Catellatospora bangladeshensis]
MIITADKPDGGIEMDARSILLVHARRRPPVPGLLRVHLYIRPVSVLSSSVGSGSAGWRPLMKPRHAKVLTVCSVPRLQIYKVLLAEPGRAWTIRELAGSLPDVSVEAVTSTLHLMMGERLMNQVRPARGLTLQLNNEGRAAIQQIVQGWSAAPTAGKSQP